MGFSNIAREFVVCRFYECPIRRVFCHDRICSSVQKSVTQWVIFPRNGRHLEKGGMFAQEVINRDRQDERSGIQKGRESGDGERACDHSGLQSSASRRICHGV